MREESAVLLVNLGSPDTPTTKDVRRYLAEFLMDPCVMDLPWGLRALIVYGTILPTRPAATAKAYSSIWTKEGSPLIHISKQLQGLVQNQVSAPVFLAMRYGNPSIPETLAQLLCTHPNIKNLLVIPLYPHYAMSSYETVVNKVKESLLTQAPNLPVSFLPPFFEDPHYIEALVATIKPYLEEPTDHLLFSYHGLPERHLKKSDPTGKHCLASEHCCTQSSMAHKTCYKAQVTKTTQKVTEALQLSVDDYSISFQSRLGKDPWIQPYTDIVLEELPKKGVKNLRVVCPAFVSDCLETLEEIEDRGREIFLQSGGKSFTMIPCLNTHPQWVNTISLWINNHKEFIK